MIEAEGTNEKSMIEQLREAADAMAVYLATTIPSYVQGSLARTANDEQPWEKYGVRFEKPVLRKPEAQP